MQDHCFENDYVKLTFRPTNIWLEGNPHSCRLIRSDHQRLVRKNLKLNKKDLERPVLGEGQQDLFRGRRGPAENARRRCIQTPGEMNVRNAASDPRRQLRSGRFPLYYVQ